MPRKRRDYAENAIYHVMMRGNNRKKIFYHPDHYRKFISFIKEAIEKYNFSLHAYCLMSNHVHLLIKIDKIPLWQIMQNIAYRYARWLNHQNKWIGHLFQGRYKAMLVKDEEYFLELCRYIHLNPVKASIVKSPEEYLWSSHHAYLSKPESAEEWLWVSSSLLRKILKSNCLDKRYSYSEYMTMSTSAKKFNPKMYVTEHGEIVMNDKIAKEHAKYAAKARKLISIDKIISEVCSAKGLSLDVVASPGKERAASQARASIVWLNQRYGDASLKKLSQLLGRSSSALCNAGARLDRVRRKDELLDNYCRTLEVRVLKHFECEKV